MEKTLITSAEAVLQKRPRRAANAILLSLVLCAMETSESLYAKIVCVRANNPEAATPYADWDTAAQTIQHAVDAAEPGDIVLVTNGFYTVGGRAMHGTMTNRVMIDKPLTVQSVNGPEVTLIVGSGSSLGNTNGEGAIRCVYLGTNACLSGFTVTNGHTLANGDRVTEQSGGGVWCGDSGIVSNCVLIGNSAFCYGGGTYKGTFYDSVLSSNSATGSDYNGGGGACYAMLNNCTFRSEIRWRRKRRGTQQLHAQR